MTKKGMSRKQALEDLNDLKIGLFRYLHREYNTALDMAMKSLEREDLNDRKAAPRGEVEPEKNEG